MKTILSHFLFCNLNKAALLLLLGGLSAGKIYAQCQAVPGELFGSGNFCAGAGVDIGIPKTQKDQSYTWIKNGSSIVNGPVGGNGSGVSYDFAMAAADTGQYKVLTTKDGCTSAEFGDVTITYSGPFPQTITGGGIMCGSGKQLGLAASEAGIHYTLLRDELNVVSERDGTGTSLTFDSVFETGIYTVTAEKTNCGSIEFGSAIVTDRLAAPFAEGFNTSGNTILPSCWSAQLINGAGSIAFKTASSNPSTTPYEGSRYVFWNSFNLVAGSEARLVSPLVDVMQPINLNIDFYWYNNNNTSFNSGNYLNEGMQVQYSFNGVNWTDAGAFISRHDGSLAAGTGAWKKKTITLDLANIDPGASPIYIGFKFHSEKGNNCSMDSLAIYPDCSSAPLLILDNPVTVTIPSGTGAINFAGVYPNNSNGSATPGKEMRYRFIPPETGVYYINLISSSYTIDHLYKPASPSCSDNGWTGIGLVIGNRAIGMLQAGTAYDLMFDNKLSAQSSETFKISKASIIANNVFSCNASYIYNPIPAHSTKIEYLLDGNGNLVASLDFSAISTNINNAYASYYSNSSVVRRDDQNREYLDRNFTLNAPHPSSEPIGVKLYFKKTELQRLINAGGDGLADVQSINDLNITSVRQDCGGSIIPNYSGRFLQQTGNGAYDDSIGFVSFSAPLLNTFFLHGGTRPLSTVPAEGSLDTSFDDDGKVIKSFAGSARVNALAIQADEKIVTAGVLNNGINNDFNLTRYNIDGSPDKIFGNRGVVTTDVGNADNAFAVAILSNGKIIAGGKAGNGSASNFALVRYNNRGSLDSTFGTNGKVITDFNAQSDVCRSLAVQTDGKIIAAGNAGPDFAMVRYRSNGTIDNGFGTNGKLTTDFNAGDDTAFSVLLQEDGKIILAGCTGTSNAHNFALARYKTNGSLDSSFGINGKQTTDFNGGDDYARAAGILSNEKSIVLAGFSIAGGNSDIAIAKYDSTGKLIKSFGNSGKIVTDYGGNDQKANAVELGTNGKILVAGYAYNGSDSDFILMRYTPAGKKDSTFGTNGKVTTDFNNNNDYAAAIKLQVDGRIVVAGFSTTSAPLDRVVLARYNADSSITNSNIKKERQVFATSDNLKLNTSPGIFISPNPVQQYIHISGLSGPGIKHIYISDIAGRVLEQFTTSEGNYTCSVKQLPAGMYYVSVEKHNTWVHAIFMKE